MSEIPPTDPQSVKTQIFFSRPHQAFESQIENSPTEVGETHGLDLLSTPHSVSLLKGNRKKAPGVGNVFIRLDTRYRNYHCSVSLSLCLLILILLRCRLSAKRSLSYFRPNLLLYIGPKCHAVTGRYVQIRGHATILVYYDTSTSPSFPIFSCRSAVKKKIAAHLQLLRSLKFQTCRSFFRARVLSTCL
ncbi:hypothetical protein P389DRAFT_108686 [Cystobasidium minutum MCA 4210]|uniref:uncharacterized protein n=1 Tax=Cystobasidium minutum MCA 4210 TaxID=1397322 RepID=UPI0034CDF94E|eukprot:jgi/Rhomi1/108686/CE108685_635